MSIDTPWAAKAACAGMAGSVFFPETPDGRAGKVDYDAARQVCRHCTVREECLDFALDLDVRHGMWGGMSPAERRTFARHRHKETA